MIKKQKQNVIFVKHAYFSYVTPFLSYVTPCGWGKLFQTTWKTACGNLYYIDCKCKTLISAFCIIGNCPTPPTRTEKMRNKEVEIFLIDHDMH